MTEKISCLKIAKLSLNKFSNLPKNAENCTERWNVLSTIIQYNKSTDETKVVALGTGTKCIGLDKLCPNGTILNDSHAEVMCRRAFLRFLYSDMLNSNQLLKFNEKNTCFTIDSNISFHFFSTHLPCGDATIIEDFENDFVPSKKIKLDNDIVCTGAKLLGVYKTFDEKGKKSDPLDQDFGALRTKPGRGVRTLSMSCSDKLSKWNILGLQGALLDTLLEKPIYLSTLNFCCNNKVDSIKRAIFKRWDHKIFKNNRFFVQNPEIKITNGITFDFAKSDDKKPTANSLYWSDIPESERPFETSVNGKREGITKKALKKNPECGNLLISKAMLLKQFNEVLLKYPEVKNKIFKELDIKELTYKKIKKLCKNYSDAWNILKVEYFEKWTKKPDNLLDFKLVS